MSGANRPQHFDVNRTPMVAIDCGTLGLRRYVGRECTHEASLEGAERSTGRELRDMIELFREAPARALGQHAGPLPELTDQVPA